MSGKPSRPLRIALLIDGLSVPAWQADLVRAIAGDAGFSLALGMVVPPARGRRNSVVSAARQFAHRLLTVLDEMRIRRGRLPNPWRLTVAGGDLPFVAAGRSIAGDRPGILRLTEKALARLRNAAPDVVLSLAARRWDGEVLSVARLGLWELDVGRLSGVSSYARREATVGVDLRRRRVDGSRALLRRATVFVDPLSVVRTNWHIAWNMNLLALASLRTATGGRSPEEGEAAALDDDVPPSALAVLAAALRLAWETTLEALARRARPPRWEVRVQAARGYLSEEGGPDLNGAALRPVPQPVGHDYADPMLVEDGGKHWLLIEDICHSDRKGRIGVIELDDQGRARGHATPVIERPYHLSYPFVFRWRDDLWMIPESSAARTVELYRAVDGPRSWALERVLMENVFVCDATLLEHDGKWWMFATMDPHGVGSHGALHLFSADTPLGPWRPHRHNPVVLDVRCARPAGPLFRHDGRLYRPAQDCSLGYGHAMRLMEVRRLDDRGYVERPAGRIAPDLVPGGLALHTWCHAGGLAAIDVQCKHSTVR